MKVNKFVINDGDLILGEVEFHEDLIHGRNRSKTVGGGRWYEDIDNAIVEGETSEIIKWLKPFDGVAIGDGVPMLEHFTIMHINDEL